VRFGSNQAIAFFFFGSKAGLGFLRSFAVVIIHGVVGYGFADVATLAGARTARAIRVITGAVLASMIAFATNDALD